ncbi:TolC family protein [Tichowtungia aerotolerans]|uniref:TolC family protein n=1 Tax=Tichowtungia aerotolerans TaxID=2697043 RepID=A0A6P1MDE3_9BACT|nr:TolC family protein [Tichowtungia aerotolerans]QHI70088.1 TolC family protein [Tichowtungia aerotolerans]
MKKAFITIILLSAAVQANELGSYLTEAAQNNPGLEAAFNQWKAALEKVPQVQALPDPRFSYSYFIEQVETRVGPQEQRFGIAQVFPMFGKLKLRGGMAMEAAEAEHQRYEQQKLNLFYRVKSAYHEYSYLHRAIEITQQHLILLQNMEEVARTRFQTGELPQSALIQLQVELGKTEDKLKTLNDLRKPLSAGLSAALNRPDPSLLPRPEPIQQTSVSFTDDEAAQWLKESSPTLERVDAVIRKEEKNAALARKARYPDIMLGLDYIQTGEARMSSVSDSGKDPLMASVSINVPIWFGKLKAGEQEAYHRKIAAENLRTDQENQLTADLQMTLYKFRDAERKVDLYQQTLLPKAEQAMESARESFEAGSLGYISLLEAERTLLEFQLAAERSLADREIRLAEIEMLTNHDF